MEKTYDENNRRISIAEKSFFYKIKIEKRIKRKNPDKNKRWQKKIHHFFKKSVDKQRQTWYNSKSQPAKGNFYQKVFLYMRV